jgi:hypothetical protein
VPSSWQASSWAGAPRSSRGSGRGVRRRPRPCGPRQTWASALPANPWSSGRPAHRLDRCEIRHRLHQLLRLQLQALGCRGALLDERGVLLRHLVELRHRVVDLADAGRLLAGGGHDLVDQVGHALHLRDDVAHRVAGLVDQLRAGLHPLDTAADQRLDLRGRLGAALCQRKHLTGHHREAAALLAGACGLDRRVESQEVGLERDAVDGADDLGDAVAARARVC